MNRNANLTRRLILSPFYQRFWGSRFTFRDDQNTTVQVDNSEGGSRNFSLGSESA
jgi:hypothetical protein